MFVVQSTGEERKLYNIFSFLRKNAEEANITTLNQISLYVAKSMNEVNVETDLVLIFNAENKCYELLLCDGTKIRFSNNSNNFGFEISKKGKSISMTIMVRESDRGNLSTASVYGEIRTKDGMYVVSFKPKDMSDDSLKFVNINYYTDDEINWVNELLNEKIDGDFDVVAKKNEIYPFADMSSFVLLPEIDPLFDCFNGYIVNTLSRINLLYDNISIIRGCVLRRKLQEKRCLK